MTTQEALKAAKPLGILLAKLAGLITVLGTIQTFVVWLLLPHINNHIDERIDLNQSSKSFETRVELIGEAMIDKPAFQLLLMKQRVEFEKHLEERLKHHN